MSGNLQLRSMQQANTRAMLARHIVGETSRNQGHVGSTERMRYVIQTSTPFPLLRTYLSTVGRSLKIVVINLLNLISISATLVGLSLQNIDLIVVSSVSLIVGLLAIGVTTITWYRAVQDLRLHYDPQSARLLRVSERLADSGYEILSRRSQPQDALLTSPQINSALFNGSTSALLSDHRRFRPRHPAAIAHVLLREFTQRKSVILFNGTKVRLVEEPLLTPGGSLTSIKVQPTRYFHTMITNNAVGVRLTSYRTRHDVFDGTKSCFPRRQVPICDQSPCSNQIGASTIAITSDDYLVLVEQGRRSNLSGNLLAPSGSGSADWKDIENISDLRQFVKHIAMRELVEECGLTDFDISWLRIVGFGRLLRLGGLPQFFCLARLNCRFEQIKVRRSERSLIDYHIKVDAYYGKQEGFEAVLEVIRRLCKEDRRISSSLWWNLELLKRLPTDALQGAFADDLAIN